MDKILRRVRMSERQVVRRAGKRARKGQQAEKKGDYQPHVFQDAREVRQSLRQAIVTRREDWELGPLAPRRDVPQVLEFNPDKQLHWGTMSVSRAMSQVKLRPLDAEDRMRWAGGVDHLCLAEGDRVVVTEGSHKGKIDRVVAINKENGTVRLHDTKVNITIPAYFVNFEGMTETAAVPARISIGSVRLVHPITDEATGVTKDVIIRELRPIKVVRDRMTRTETWSRLVPGLNVTIPWPKVERPVEDELDSDTPRIHVDEATYIPTLLRPPMPETLVDELRNQYSKFRTRHTDEYIAKKEAEEAEKRALKDKEREMLTPVQEFNRLEREKRRARGQPVLTDEMLAKIGEVMAKNVAGRKTKRASIPSIPAETKTVAEEVPPPSSSSSS